MLVQTRRNKQVPIVQIIENKYTHRIKVIEWMCRAISFADLILIPFYVLFYVSRRMHSHIQQRNIKVTINCRNMLLLSNRTTNALSFFYIYFMFKVFFSRFCACILWFHQEFIELNWCIFFPAKEWNVQDKWKCE